MINEEKDTNKPQDDSFKTPLDNFIIGDGFELPKEEKKEEPKEKRRTGKLAIKSIVWIVSVIIVSLGFATAILIGISDFLGIGPGRGHEIEIKIDQGSSSSKIAKTLKQEGVIQSEIFFRVFSKLKGYDGKFKYGVYILSDEEGYSSIANKLINDGAKAETVRVTIPEMSSVDDIIKLLVDAGVSSKDELVNAIEEIEFNFDFIDKIPEEKVYWRLEGYLFPETYSFYSYDDEECARLAIMKMLNEFDSRITAEMRAKANELGYSLHEVLTLASIIELEAGAADFEDKQKVAEVFYNRLRDWELPYLQSNPTRDYPYGEGKYNTYETAGLPVGPLCSPSMESIKAALNPSTAEPENYYFITDKFMNFYYNKTLEAHQNTNWDLINKGIYYPD